MPDQMIPKPILEWDRTELENAAQQLRNALSVCKRIGIASEDGEPIKASADNTNIELRALLEEFNELIALTR